MPREGNFTLTIETKIGFKKKSLSYIYRSKTVGVHEYRHLQQNVGSVLTKMAIVQILKSEANAGALADSITNNTKSL